MPRQRFAIEFEDVEGNVVVAFSDIPAQTKQEAIEKGKAYLQSLTPTAIPQRRPPSLAEAIHATLNSVYGKMAQEAAQDTGDGEEGPEPPAPVTKATKGKRKPKK